MIGLLFTLSAMQTWALLGLLIYFNLLMGIVLAEKHNQTQEDYFFAGRELPFLALSMTFVASWWSAGLALSTANLFFNDCLGAFVYHGTDESLVALYDPQDELLSARYCSLAGKWLSMMIFLFMHTSCRYATDNLFF